MPGQSFTQGRCEFPGVDQNRGDGLHHAVQAVARMHNLALTA
ncbi:hypothetical protein [Streptomyces carpinensis]|uniref:Transposase n=1 Tax=Streptomyces carpinensis TaxID=66369 RepID=A0ABV1VWC6_9ACTN|nr:hypothetical protein [Streptomyces carpinensis]